MTTIAHPRIDQTRRPTLRQLVQRWADGVTAPVRWLRARYAAIATAGQLGPDAETQVGRWTGARV
jgi:hypothetical protein